MPELEIEGLDALYAKLDRLAAMRRVSGALLAGGAMIKSAMQLYPAQVALTRKSVYGRSFVSDRQRRFFFYALKKGILHSPYRRTNVLGNKWTVEAQDGGLTVEVGNNTPYGPYVQSARLQTKYHKAAGWQTDAAVLERQAPAVVGLVRDAIQAEIDE